MNNSSDEQLNNLSSDTVIEGDIRSKTDIQINSTLKGNIQCDGMVTIDLSGTVEGNITALNTLVQGEVHGNVTSKSHTYVQASGHVKGNIITDKIILEDGATYNKVVLKRKA